MADIAASDVTYSGFLSGSREGSRGYRRVGNISFGDSALTYPSGGVALTKAKMGCPNYIESLILIDADNDLGLIFKWDATNNKLLIFRSGGFTPAGTLDSVSAGTPAGSISAGVIPVTAGTAGDAVTNNAGVLESTGGQDLAVNAQTFTGSALAGHTHTLTGTAVAAASLAQLVAATTAVPPVALVVEVVGW